MKMIVEEKWMYYKEKINGKSKGLKRNKKLRLNFYNLKDCKVYYIII